MCSDEVAKEIVHACSLEGPTEYVESKSWLSKENGEVTENTVCLIITVFFQTRLASQYQPSHLLMDLPTIYF
jgi:hypothetical protein